MVYPALPKAPTLASWDADVRGTVVQSRPSPKQAETSHDWPNAIRVEFQQVMDAIKVRKGGQKLRREDLETLHMAIGRGLHG